jgi:hypothetical protein
MTLKKTPERRTKAKRVLAKRREKFRWELDSPVRRKTFGRRVVDHAHLPGPKNRVEFLANFTDFCILTPSGLLGYFNKQRKFIVNTRLTEALLNNTINFLKAYQADPEGSNHRIAIIRQTEQARAWGAETLILEEFVVRRLYAVSGQPTAELTAFQKRNRENSLYRGMELLLERRDEAMPGIPIYCPVLYDRGLTLADYQRMAGVEKYSGDSKSPVIDVLNLIAAIPVSKRNATEIQELINGVHNRIVKKDLRKTPKFELVEDIKTRSRSGNSFSLNTNKNIIKRK